MHDEEEDYVETDPISIEKRNRIRLLIAAYLYEYEPSTEPLMTDSEFDQNCKKVDLTIITGHKTMDKFFKDKDDGTGTIQGGGFLFHMPDEEFDKLKFLVNRFILKKKGFEYLTYESYKIEQNKLFKRRGIKI